MTLDLANFRYAKFKRVRFKDCMLDEADFYSVDLKRVFLKVARLQRLNFLRLGAKMSICALLM